MRIRSWIVISTSLFLAGMALGLTVHGQAADFIAQQAAGLKELGATLGPFQLSTALFILAKNISTLLLSFLLSPLLCLVPILALVMNGWLLSFVGALVVQQKSLGVVLAALLPHGIIEIPAVLLGEAAALSFGTAVLMAIFSQRRRQLLGPTLKQDIKYLGLACLLLVPAAFIETFITPLLIG